jgi:hypothetical protein
LTYLLEGSAIIGAESNFPRDHRCAGASQGPAEPKAAEDARQNRGHKHWHNPLPWCDGIGDFRIARVLDDFSILKCGHSGSPVAVRTSPSHRVADVPFAGMGLTVIGLPPPNAAFK